MTGIKGWEEGGGAKKVELETTGLFRDDVEPVIDVDDDDVVVASTCLLCVVPTSGFSDTTSPPPSSFLSISSPSVHFFPAAFHTRYPVTSTR